MNCINLHFSWRKRWTSVGSTLTIPNVNFRMTSKFPDEDVWYLFTRAVASFRSISQMDSKGPEEHTCFGVLREKDTLRLPQVERTFSNDEISCLARSTPYPQWPAFVRTLKVTDYCNGKFYSVSKKTNEYQYSNRIDASSNYLVLRFNKSYKTGSSARWRLIFK